MTQKLKGRKALSKQRSRSGFTMVELMGVIVTVGVLGSVAVPQFLDYRNEARNAAATAIEQAVTSAIKLQTQNAILRCDNSLASSPTLSSLIANDITGGSSPLCRTSQVSYPADRKFLAGSEEYPPRNPVNGLNTIGLALENAENKNFRSGTCTSSAGGEVTGWCYNPHTGQFWASTNPVYTGNTSNSESSASLSSGASSSNSSVIVAANSSSSVSDSLSSSSIASSSSSELPGYYSQVSSSSSSSVSSSSVSSASSSNRSIAEDDDDDEDDDEDEDNDEDEDDDHGSSSSSSSSVSSSSSAGGGVVSSSSSSNSSVSLYASCEAVPAGQVVTVSMVTSGAVSAPAEATFTTGGSTHYCLCKPHGNGYSIQSPSVTGATNGNGHSNSFFLIASACSGIQDDDDDGVDNSEDDDYSSSSSSSAASTGVGSTGSVTSLLNGNCNVVKVSLNGGGNSLSLTALGKIYDSNGTGLYSVWRIRNSTNSSINARLVGYPSTTILNSISAAASYDYIVRSSFVLGTATHVLTNLSSMATSTKAASASSYSDSSTGLCVQ